MLDRVSKIANDKTYSGWDWTYDGAYPEPRVKKDDKKRRQRHRRRIIDRMTRQEIKNYV